MVYIGHRFFLVFNFNLPDTIMTTTTSQTSTTKYLYFNCIVVLNPTYAKNTLWDRAMKYMGYKPGYWAAYFVYCSIPVIAYVWFLLRRRNEPNEPEEELEVGHLSCVPHPLRCYCKAFSL
uniref:(northern house mosquito) hypothetical protein n=1 Tax=Culex pipiens TaxID=7175 RepID=A0A8D8CQ19_CULPI